MHFLNPYYMFTFVSGFRGRIRLAARRGRENRLLWTLALASRRGEPLGPDLYELARSENMRAYRREIEDLAEDLENGVPLSEALASHPRLLPPEVVAGILAGEVNGNLTAVLQDQARKHTQSLRLLTNEYSLGSAWNYGRMVLIVLLCVVSFLCYWIIPKYKEIFNDFGVELPPATRKLIHMADWGVEYWYLLVIIGGLVWAGWRYLTAPFSGIAPARSSLLSRWWPRINSPPLLRSLGYAANERRTMISVVESLSEIEGKGRARGPLQNLKWRLEGGRDLGEALLAEKFVTAKEAEALNCAAGLGHLSWALPALSERMEMSRRRAWWTLREWTWPLLILGLGLCVLFFCVAMFLPLTKLISDLS